MISSRKPVKAWSRCLAVFAGLVAFVPAAVAQVNVDAINWGFDNRVVTHRINPLNVLLSNPGSDIITLNVSLSRVNGLVGVDISQVREVTLSPFSSRWVQFYPYIFDATDQWQVSWGPLPRGAVTVDQPGFGVPAVVLLTDRSLAAGAGGDLPRFDPQLFPPTVAATDGLHAVVLADPPSWDATRRRAFADWVRRGGIVHLVRGLSGRHPTFSDELTGLNQPGDQFTFGAGRVFRHDRHVNDLGLVAMIVPRSAMQPQTFESASVQWETPDQALLQSLRTLSESDHNWAAIFWSGAGYVLLVGPGCWLLRRRDYRLSIALLLVLVTGFTGLYFYIGQRGYGEQAATFCIVRARHLEGDRYDATVWMDAFATTGGAYRFQFTGPFGTFSSCQNYETLRGSRFIVGRDAAVNANVPLFSNRSLMFRGELTGPTDPDRNFTVPRSLTAGAVVGTVPTDLPGRVVDAWLVSDGVAVPLDWQDTDRQLLIRGRAVPIEGWIDVEALEDGVVRVGDWHHRLGDSDTTDRYGNERGDRTIELRSGARLAAAASLGLLDRHEDRPAPQAFQPAVLIVTDAFPEGFKLGAGSPGEQVGLIVYHVTPMPAPDEEPTDE